MMLSVYCLLFIFFFFKQKTAYEMRISDWSSDVCSSDLAAGASARQSSEPYRITVDGDRTRPAFSNDEILATTRRATSVENDPSTYLDGEEMGGSAGV